jgi:glycosyltransferase involved in cell wall biosynthesis
MQRENIETNKLVSIIMPLYNAEQFIAQSIESVLKQSYKNFELLIVDDKSIDNSIKIVKKYMQEDKRIKLFFLDVNSGPAKARNKAIKEANGRYISFLDSDDIWLPNKLQDQTLFLNENNLVLTYSSYETIDENSKYINTRYVLPQITYKDMLKSSQIGNLTGIYDVIFFGKVYMEDIGHEDYIMWLKLLKNIPFAKGINYPLAQYRVASNSISSNKIKALKWQWYIYRKIEKLNFLQSCYYFVHYVYNAIKKRI